MKWNETRRNFKVGYKAFLKDKHSRNQWPMAHDVQTEPDKNGMAQRVMLKLGNTKSSKTLRRPISNLVLLVSDNENWISKKVGFPDEGALMLWMLQE